MPLQLNKIERKTSQENKIKIITTQGKEKNKLQNSVVEETNQSLVFSNTHTHTSSDVLGAAVSGYQ